MFQIKDGEIFTSNGDQVVPDASGIITLTINKVSKRFIKEKFITWASTNPDVLKGCMSPKKLRVKKTYVPRVKKERIPKPKQVYIPKPKKIKPPKPIPYSTPRKKKIGVPIELFNKGVSIGTFISITEAAKHIGKSTSMLSKIYRGVTKKNDYSLLIK